MCAEKRTSQPDKAGLLLRSFRKFSTTAESCGTAGREVARLWVARANALQARTSGADAARVRALGAYKDFLALWKDADPDIPILKKAKADYAKLH